VLRGLVVNQNLRMQLIGGWIVVGGCVVGRIVGSKRIGSG